MPRFHGFTATTLLLATLFGGGASHAEDELTVTHVVVARPDTTKSNRYYIGNRAPLARSPFIKLPIGAIVPKGWLRKQLELEADGMAGRLPEVSQWVQYENNGWVSPKANTGWEELPYWIKGFGDLGYVLDNERIKKEAQRWIDGIIATQQSDGYFGPEGLRTALGGVPDIWPHMPVLNAMQSYYEYTGDKRVLTLMERYFRWQLTIPPKCFGLSWAATRCGDNIESIYWLYNRLEGKPEDKTWLLELSGRIHKHSADWSTHVCNWHNVNMSQGFREPSEYWMQAHDENFLQGAERNYGEFMGKYGQFPGGGFAGDENCRPSFHDPRQGFETCGIVELMHSFEMLTRITGNPQWSDRCEELAVNTLPAALTPDLKALHYLTGANMVQLDRKNKSPGIQNGGEMLSYSPGGVYRCCQHNHVMGWPYMAEELWLATADDGLCASLYAASEVTAQVGDGTKVKIVEETDYPFEDTIRLKLSMPKSTTFPLYLRMPGWAKDPVVKINGKQLDIPAGGLNYLRIERGWSDGDEVTLQLPMQFSVRTWKENHNAVSINYGPLTFSLKIGESWKPFGRNTKWPDSEVFPTTPFNYGLELDAKDPAATLKLVRKPGPIAPQPFTQETVPMEVTAPARKIPGWTQDGNGLLGTLRQSPVLSDEPLETVTLIPMGAARLRISAFPTIGKPPCALPWAKPDEVRASASHTHDSDTLEALNDGLLPNSSSDESIPRFTWWNHKGTTEWVQYEFDKPKKLNGASVYWFDDTGHGGCRVPKSWTVLLRQNGKWVEPADVSGLKVQADRFNTVNFKATAADAIRLEVRLQDNFSGGILEWRLSK
jgi:hypothetical protein